jgi:hypothetical protein
MVAGGQPAARLAFATTGKAGSDRLAEQQLCKLFRKRGFANAGGAYQKHRMRQALEALAEQLLPQRIVPVYLFFIIVLQLFSQVLY